MVRRAIAQTFLFAAGMMVGLALLRPYTGEAEDANPGFWVDKVDHPANLDLIAVGDSRVYRSIAPSAFAPLRAYNFGFSAMALDPGYLQDSIAKLDQKSAKKILLVGLTPNAFSDASRTNGFTSYSHRHLLDRRLLQFSSAGVSWIRPYTPAEWAALLKPRQHGLPNQEYHDDGWVSSTQSPGDDRKTVELYSARFRGDAVRPERVEQFLRAVAEIVKSGIRVVVFRPPVSKALREVEDRQSGLDVVNVKRRLLQAGAEWLDVPEDLPTYDGSHLTAESGRKLSAWIAERVR